MVKERQRNWASTLPVRSAVEKMVEVSEKKPHSKDHPMLVRIPNMVDRFLNMVDGKTGEQWILVYQSKLVNIHQLKNAQNCFKIEACLGNTAGTCFDLLSDVNRRGEWDRLCEYGKVVEEINHNSRVVYVKMKPIWPTAPRDIVLLSHFKLMPNGQMLNVTQSVTHEAFPEDKSGSIVRMEAGIAGQLCWATGESTCNVVQIVNGDLKGWIPSSVISFIATKALPESFVNLNKLVETLPAQSHSNLFKEGINDIPHEQSEMESLVVQIATLQRKVMELEEKLSKHEKSQSQQILLPWVLKLLALFASLGLIRKFIKR